MGLTLCNDILVVKMVTLSNNAAAQDGLKLQLTYYDVLY